MNKYDRRVKWEYRKSHLEKIGKLEYIWECEWKEEIKRCQSVQTDIPRILFGTENESDLLKGILDGSLFGYAVVSVHCPEKLLDQYTRDGFLFPPIFQKMKIGPDLLSPYMQEKYIESESSPEEPTLVQTYNGVDLLLYTPLIRFYASKGFKIYNFKKFTQYIPGRVFSPYVKKGFLIILYDWVFEFSLSL